MDFDRITENSEIFDPNGQVVRSTQVVEESSSESEGQTPGVTVGANLPGAELPQLDEGTPGGSQSTRTEETTNYETSRTTRTHIRESGNIRRLSVAVMVNGKIGLDGEGNRTYEPRTDEEIEQIKALVRSAAGLDEERGDRLEVVNIPFADIGLEEELISDGLFWGIEKAEIMRLAEIFVLGILAILVVLFVVRPLIQRLLSEEGFSIQGAGVAALPGGPAATAALGAPDPTGNTAMLEGGAPNTPRLPRASGERSVADEIEQMIDVNKIEGRVRDSSIRKIGEIIQKHPDEAVTILRNWLYQDA